MVIVIMDRPLTCKGTFILFYFLLLLFWFNPAAVKMVFQS